MYPSRESFFTFSSVRLSKLPKTNNDVNQQKNSQASSRLIGSSDRVISLGEYDADCKKHAEKQRIFLIVQNGFAKILFQISTKHQNMKIPLFIDIFQLLSQC